MLLSHAEFKEPNVSNVMAPTNLNITDISLGVIKLMKKQTHLDSKQRRAWFALIPSDASIIKVIIKQTPIYVPFGDIVSIVTGTTKNNKNSVKVGVT